MSNNNTGAVVRTSGRKPKRKSYQDYVEDGGKSSRNKIFKSDIQEDFSSVTDVNNPTKSSTENTLHSDTDLKDGLLENNGTVDAENKVKGELITKDQLISQQTESSTKQLESKVNRVLKPTMKQRGRGKLIDPIKSHPRGRKPKSSQEPERIYICRKAGCGKKIQRCAVKADAACCEATGYSSRWYHLSLEEHYCNACFEQFYRNKYDGFEQFHEWKRAWMNNSKADSAFKNITTYIPEKKLSYWVKCTRCEHWRQLVNEVELSIDINKTYVCSMGSMENTLSDSTVGTGQPHVKYTCYQKHDTQVETVLDPSIPWMSSLNYTPFLKYSPAAPYLTSYYPDGVGMSAVDIDETPHIISFGENDVSRPPDICELVTKQSETKELPQNIVLPINKKGDSRLLMSPGGRKSINQSNRAAGAVNGYFHPFYKPFEHGKALCMRPDVMELDEAQEFPEFVKDQSIYLAVRNLVVALWTLHKKSFLTVKRCCQYIILRGLTRIFLCEHLLPRILCFATYKGLINIGALSSPSSVALLPNKYLNKDVIIIGAGPAGLGGARQLHNFGIKVTILEARDRIGGRVHDDWSLNGTCVGRGAQIVNGCVNNPMALISEQLGLKMQVLRPQCDLYDSNGVPISMHCDKRMDFHFNALLDIIADWRRTQQENSDSSLGEKIIEAHTEWKRQSGLTFSELEEQLLQFHVGNLEFACGACLDKVSAFHWDQNETFAQFGGDHTLVQYGFSALLKSLAYNLDIRLSSPVTSIDYTNEKVEVQTDTGDIFSADCVLITVPLAVLKSKSILFKPELPNFKQDAMGKIGCGCIEKVGLEFPERFWEDKINGANYFGYIPSDKIKKGFFTMFYDMPSVSMEKGNVLMSVISGDSVDAASKMTEQEVVDIAMTVLRAMFPNKSIPQPIRYFVTRWKTDPYAQMAYSYIKTGSSGEDYDRLAKSIDGKLYFAGEATNRHFPQTVTGAYLSGLREAAKIAVFKTEQSS
ncbi:lysine-specific histone demethylase 2-like [Styela clava]